MHLNLSLSLGDAVRADTLNSVDSSFGSIVLYFCPSYTPQLVVAYSHNLSLNRHSLSFYCARPRISSGPIMTYSYFGDVFLISARDSSNLNWAIAFLILDID